MWRPSEISEDLGKTFLLFIHDQGVDDFARDLTETVGDITKL